MAADDPTFEEEKTRMNAVLAAIPWRCFNCDFITTDPVEAEAHFGERDDPDECRPICKWWFRMDDGERRTELQENQKYIRRLHDEAASAARQARQIEGLEYQVDTTNSQPWKGYKPFRNCTSIHDIFCLYDSMEGRALSAEEKVKDMADAILKLKGVED